jgi:hypothetical protein
MYNDTYDDDDDVVNIVREGKTCALGIAEPPKIRHAVHRYKSAVCINMNKK